MMDKFYDELPEKYAAIKKIKSQRFYGRDHQDLVIQYIYSHAYWYVGSAAGYINARGRCAEEACKLYESIFEKNDPFRVRMEIIRAVFG